MRVAVTVILLLIFNVSSLAQQQLAPSVVWQKSYGGSGDDQAFAVAKTIDNGFVLVGTTKSSDGDLTGHYGSTSTSDAWIVKVSSNGQIEWQRNMGGSGDDNFTSVHITPDGSIICVGTINSNDNDGLQNHGAADIFVVKFGRSGNLIWKKCYGGSKVDMPGKLRINIDGTMYLIGTVYSNDGDVSGNHGFDRADVWVVKLDAAGTILSQRCFGGSGMDVGHDVMEGDGGSFFMAIENGSDDGDFGTGNGANSPRGQLLKINTSNNVIWKTGGSNRTDYMQIDKLTRNGIRDSIVISTYVIICYPASATYGASIQYTIDEPSFGTKLPSGFLYVGNCNIFYDALIPGVNQNANNMTLTNEGILWSFASNDSVTVPNYNHGYSDGLLMKVDKLGTVLWKRFVGGAGEDKFYATAVLNEFEFVAAGMSDNNGGEPGNHGGKDFWLVKMGKVNLVKGTVFADHNVNGTKESAEPLLSNILVESSKGSQSFSSYTVNGSFTNSVDTGLYSTRIRTTNLPYYQSVPTSFNSSFNSYNTTDNSPLFALQPVPGKRDYRVELIPLSLVRPGFDVSMKIQLINVGTDTLRNKPIRFVKDNRLQFVFSIPTQTIITVDTIQWQVPILAPRDTFSVMLALKALAPPVVNFGDSLVSTALIDTTGDLSKPNNTSLLQQRVTGAFDPNDKLENRGGILNISDYESGQYLYYTIRFQNTGNDTAFNVLLRDTLSTKLESSTIEIVSASHPYKASISDGRYFTIEFPRILLVDSNRNEPLSHGYLTYRIKPIAGLSIGDTILNSASIYFDFNLPIKTNTQITVIRPNSVTAPAQPVLTGLATNYCNNLGIQKGKISNLPAAGSGVTILVKLDATSLPVEQDSSFSFNVNTLTTGSHTITVSFTNAGGTKTTTHNFTVATAIIPDVNVSSNITTIVNLIDQVVVTASNATGGGAGPLYTFGKDRNFASLWQAESGSAVLSLNPSSLSLGDNWIYVRMKSNATCISSTIATDSIKLVRSMVTGIIDPENPGKVISLYPNPFNKQVFIKGLSVSKTYTIVLSNLNGQVLMQKRITNRNSVELEFQPLLSGNYLLSIYDEKRRRLLGTLPVTKQ